MSKRVQWSHLIISVVFVVILLLAYYVKSRFCCSQEYDISDTSTTGAAYYAQGMVALNNTVYVSADDHVVVNGRTYDKNRSFPRVLAFNAKTYDRTHLYGFRPLYDSAPLIINTSAGKELIVAHEHQLERSRALNLATGETEWVSKSNQPGNYFFGYSYFINIDGSKNLFIGSTNGLHAISGDNGNEIWHSRVKSVGGCTPAVEQHQGVIYYQYDGFIAKLKAINGDVLKSARVVKPNQCYSSNTVLHDYRGKQYIATYWYDPKRQVSAIRVFDSDLSLLWERSDLSLSKKEILTVYEDIVVVGSGNEWSMKALEKSKRKVSAYNIRDGGLKWETDLSQYCYTAISNVIYYNDNLYAISKDNVEFDSKIFRINAHDGVLLEVLDLGRPTSSCAPPIIAYGKIFNGDLYNDNVVVVEIAEDKVSSWPSVFFDPQRNTYANSSKQRFKRIPMREVKGINH